MWKILEFQFDDATNVLIGPGGRHLLEPKPSALLAFLIANAGRDISRDELIEHVWQGQIVSDGAINRVVVQLRKALNDNDKIRRFIVTVPKTGYRFVPTAEKIEAVHAPVPKRGFRAGIVAFLVISAVLVIGLWPAPRQAEPVPTVSPLVRLSSEQFGPAISPSGSQVVFSVRTEYGSDLMMADGLATPPVPIGQTGGWATSATWAPNGYGLAYQFHTDNTCQIMWLPIVDGLASEKLYDCPLSGQMSLAFSADGATLYFTERPTAYDPAELFALDIIGKTKRRPSQPAAYGRGNHFVDVHPVSGKVLLLSDHAAGQTSAYEIDDTAATFSQIMDWPYRLDQAIWGHAGSSIVHPDMHPSYQLLETDVSSGEPKVLATESRRIKEPIRANDGAGYIYTSYLHNRDIWLNGTEAAPLNSSVMDYAPSLSNDGKRIAFISKRTGLSRVFFDDVAGGNQTSLALHIDGVSIFRIEWSESDQHVLVASSQGIWLINTETYQIVDRHRSVLPIYGATWISDSEIGYSQRENGGWQRYRYQLGEPTSTTGILDPWAFVVGAEENRYHIGQAGQVWLNETTQLPLECAPPLYGRHFTYRTFAGRFFCPSKDYAQILSWGPEHGTQLVGDYDVRLGQFSVSRDTVVHTVLKATSSDIMRVGTER